MKQYNIERYANGYLIERPGFITTSTMAMNSMPSKGEAFFFKTTEEMAAWMASDLLSPLVTVYAGGGGGAGIIGEGIYRSRNY